MRYYTLLTEDIDVSQPFVLCDDESGNVQLRPEYAHFRCSNCGKVSEEDAIASYLSSSIRIRSKRARKLDMVELPRNFVAVSSRFVSVCKESGISGVRYTPLPGDLEFSIALVDRVPATFAKSTLRANVVAEGEWYGGLHSEYPLRSWAAVSPDGYECAGCGRHFATYGFVSQECCSLPSDPLVVVAPSFNHESEAGMRFQMHVTQACADILYGSGLKGFRFVEMGLPRSQYRSS